jgi:Prokaryotic homologs of the JAB domain
MSSAFPTTAHWMDFLAGRQVKSERTELPQHAKGRVIPSKSAPRLVAAETFEVEGDPAGPFIAGRTHVAADHWVAKRWPERFTRVLGSRSAATAARAGTAPVSAVQTPHLYHPSPRPWIEISDGAWCRIVGELKASEPDYELGGWLYASAEQRDLHVEAATEASAKRGMRSLELDPGRRRDFEDDLKRRDTGLVRVGEWHSHPVVGLGAPSDTDLQSWQAGYELLESPRDFIGLILTPSRSAGWWAPQIHAYVCSRDRLTKRVRVETARTAWDAA